MPIYEYREGGKMVLRQLPVARRDDFPNRVTVPSRVEVCPRGQPTQGDQVLRGFYRCEEKSGTASVRRIEKELGMTASQVKKVWNEP